PFLRDCYNLDYRSTHFSKCYYDLGGSPSELPSILRTCESAKKINIQAQIVARVLVLSTLYFRWYYTFLSCAAARSANTGELKRAIEFSHPKIYLVSMVFEFHITCIKQDVYWTLKWLIPYVIIGGIASLCSYMMLFTLNGLTLSNPHTLS
ncbi:hypothetical protein PMAYCL1PPCAC_14055, partial [Pristionchus mayeri]